MADHPSIPQFKPGDPVVVLLQIGLPEIAGTFVTYLGPDNSVVRIEADMANEDPNTNSGKKVKHYLLDIRYMWVRKEVLPGLKGVDA